MSLLFRMDNDVFRYLYSWLDVGCICKLDIAIGNADERFMWLHSLKTIESMEIDEHSHSHSSIRWLIMRDARATRIRVSGTTLVIGRITDQTFTGVDTLFAQNAYNGNILLHFCADIVKSSGTVKCRVRNRDIATDIKTAASIRTRGCRHLTSINLANCQDISNVGISAIAEGCHHLTSINLCRCAGISDIGVVAIAEGCHGLTSINLCRCAGISDIGVVAIAEGCPGLTSIDLSGSGRISDTGVVAIAEGCPGLTSIDLSVCRYISDISVVAIAEGCHGLTSINLSGSGRISDIGVVAIAEGCHLLTSDRKSVV